MIATIIALALAASTMVSPVEMDTRGFGGMFTGSVYWHSGNISHVIVEIKDEDNYAWNTYILNNSGDSYGDDYFYSYPDLEGHDPWYVVCTPITYHFPSPLPLIDGPNEFPDDFVFVYPQKYWLHHKNFYFPKIQI